ncbi:uncharacterized protein [Physcomitrium patens]|uniref:Checkpoint protein n=1 Tax=Physcomitrium patens TaxID=3218 RepID=A9S9W0_PHYPA|nr:uncharacterized protein LOC112286104 [Physcomitrium patens]PNR62712.1 hypothetical protein PHYPA_001136 [Physcomitrium patens]|eukprot:XP_024383861.1 uncharacterized protein LOC112286104 [Physcomitrella patens]
MKFKAFLTDHGVTLLERRFLPAFEKIGKTCHIYLTPVHFILLHNVLNSDGVQAIAQFSKDAVFDDYRISSQNQNRIAFTVDLALLLRALKSSVSIYGDRLQLKLVRKRPSLSERPMPYLTFESKGLKSAIIQDVPISQPLNRIDVEALQSSLDMAQELPRTLVQVPGLQNLQGLIDRLGKLGDVLEVAVTQYGDLHLQVSQTMVSIGSEYRKLRVLGVRSDPTSTGSASSSASRLQQAIQKGEASRVLVNMKHFAKSLQCHLTRPDAAFCGVGELDSCLFMMFQYFIPGTRLTDNTISLHYRLPVLDPGVV